MARFIIDVANVNDKDIKALCITLSEIVGEKHDYGIASAVCIDPTNDNQFHDDATKNKLSAKQLKNYTKSLVISN